MQQTRVCGHGKGWCVGLLPPDTWSRLQYTAQAGLGLIQRPQEGVILACLMHGLISLHATLLLLGKVCYLLQVCSDALISDLVSDASPCQRCGSAGLVDYWLFRLQ